MHRSVKSKLIVVMFSILIFVSTTLSGCSGKTTETSTTSGTGTVTEKKVIHLKAVTFLPKNDPLAAVVPAFVQKVKEKSNGKIIIDYLGGPEIIPTVQLAEAVQKGLTVDIGFSASSHYQALVPEGLAMPLSRIYPWEERQTKFYDLMVNYHKNANLMYLGRWMYSPFYLWSNKPVNKPEELKGMKMRTLALSDRFMKELGITPVTIVPADTYTSLERGMVEGFAWAIIGARENGWTEKVKYLINHPFFDMQNTSMIMNLNKWNSLTPQQQQVIQEASREFEKDMVDYFKKAIDNEVNNLKTKAGVKVIEFSPEDAAKYIEKAYDVEWKSLSGKISQDKVDELKKNSSKQ